MDCVQNVHPRALYQVSHSFLPPNFFLNTMSSSDSESDAVFPDAPVAEAVEAKEIPTPEKYAQQIWGCVHSAIDFLIFVGICVFPKCCNLGHTLKPEIRGPRSIMFACKHATKGRQDDGHGGTKNKWTFCKHPTKSWRSQPGSLMSSISNSIGPQQLCRLIYRFA